MLKGRLYFWSSLSSYGRYHDRAHVGWNKLRICRVKRIIRTEVGVVGQRNLRVVSAKHRRHCAEAQQCGCEELERHAGLWLNNGRIANATSPSSNSECDVAYVGMEAQKEWPLRIWVGVEALADSLLAIRAPESPTMALSPRSYLGQL